MIDGLKMCRNNSFQLLEQTRATFLLRELNRIVSLVPSRPKGPIKT